MTFFVAEIPAISSLFKKKKKFWRRWINASRNEHSCISLKVMRMCSWSLACNCV